MKTKSLISIIFIGMFVCFSCNKDSFLENKKKQELEKAKSTEVLKFASMEEFQNTINNLIEDQEYYKSLINENFTSLRYLEDLKLKSSSTEGLQEDTLVVSDAFASVLNPEREVIVANNLFKVSIHGTFKSNESNLELLRELSELESISDLLVPANDANLKSASTEQAPMVYRLVGYDDVYIYDTFDRYGGSGGNYSSSTSEPDYDNFVTKTESQTIFGDVWDAIFGYSNSTKVKFNNDNKKCVDVKLYCVNYWVYSESGVKVKTQKKGWTGLWRKTDVDEIRVGWDYVELEQTLPNLTKDLILEAKKKTKDVSDPVTKHNIKFMGIAKTEFKKKTYFSIDYILGEYKVTNKTLLKPLIKGGYQWAKSTFGTNVPKIEAVREFSPDRPKKSIMKLDKYELTAKNSDKLTFVFKNDFGLIIGFKINASTLDMDLNVFKPVATKYKIRKASIYGCAKNGSEWKGVRYNYK